MNWLKRTRCRLFFCVATFAVGLAGCTQPTLKPLSAIAKPPPAEPAAKAETPAPTDETIGAEVRRRLNIIGVRETGGIVVEVNDGVVTLRGAAPTGQAAMRAVATARVVPGVKRVVNQILAPGTDRY